MAKKRIKHFKPTLGGLHVIKKSNIPYEEKVTRQVITEKIVYYPRHKASKNTDKLEVYGVVETKHESGTVIFSERKEKPLFVVTDKGATIEYDLFEETLFNQADIDNPAYIVEGDPVNRIYYVDGQDEEGEDIEIDIEPYQRKGRINEATGVTIAEADEPLADIQANIGEYLNTFIKSRYNKMY